MNMLQTPQIDPVIHDSDFLLENLQLENLQQGPIVLTKQSEPVAVIIMHDVWMQLVARVALSELGHDLQLLPTNTMNLNEKTEDDDLDNGLAKIGKNVEPISSKSVPPVERVSDRDRMLAALRSAPPMSDENAQTMDRLIQEAREASIDYALLT